MEQHIITCSLCESIKTYFITMYNLLNNNPNKTNNNHHMRNNREEKNHKKDINRIKHKYIDRFICSICLDSTDNTKTKNFKLVTNCCHIFHKNCLKKWLTTDYMKNCPVCRTKLLNYHRYL